MAESHEQSWWQSQMLLINKQFSINLNGELRLVSFTDLLAKKNCLLKTCFVHGQACNLIIPI